MEAQRFHFTLERQSPSLVSKIVDEGSMRPVDPASRKLSLTRVAAILENYWPQLTRDVCALAVVLLAVWLGLEQSERDLGSWAKSPPNLLLLALAVIGLFGGAKVWLREPGVLILKDRIHALEDDVLECHGNYSDLLRAELAILASKLGFGHNERISVYKHDGRAFVMLGRFSSNPHYDRPGRGVYPDSQGCIRDVWSQGRAVGVNLPNSGTNLAEYVNALNRRWAVDRVTAQALRMKSRSIGGIRIEDFSTGVPIAVMIFESMGVHGINRAILDQAEAADDGRIGRFLERMRAVEPSPSYAKNKGF